LKGIKWTKKIISTKAVGVGGENGGNSPISRFVMSPVTEAQVTTLFSSLNVQKSSLDVPNKLIKIAAEPLWKPLNNNWHRTFIFFFHCIYLNMVVTTSKANFYPIPRLPHTYFFFSFHSHMQNRFLFSYLFNYSTDVN